MAVVRIPSQCAGAENRLASNSPQIPGVSVTTRMITQLSRSRLSVSRRRGLNVLTSKVATSLESVVDCQYRFARAGKSLRRKTHSGVIKPSPRATIENGRPWRWNGCGGPTTFWMTMSTVPIPCVSMIAMRPVNGSSPRTIWCRSGLMARQEVSEDDQRL